MPPWMMNLKEDLLEREVDISRKKIEKQRFKLIREEIWISGSKKIRMWKYAGVIFHFPHTTPLFHGGTITIW